MILVFKTNVSTYLEVEKIKPQLNKSFPNAKWNFDLQDCDNILRIDNLYEISDVVMNLFKENNFECELLGD
jgi:hypothetical protein